MSALYRTLSGHALTTNKFYRIYLSAKCGAPCFSTDSAGNRAVFLFSANSRRSRFVVSHEVSHLGLWLRLGDRIGTDGGDPPNSSLAATSSVSGCANGGTHTPGSNAFPMGTEEWGNGAFNEGFAQYVSASTWNRRSDADCDYRGTAAINNCYDPGIAFDTCYTNAGLTQTLDTGFERDWLTTLWAIERTDGCAISFRKIVDIVIGAEPLTWDNADGPDAIWNEASSHLSGSKLTCFRDTLDARIKF